MNFVHKIKEDRLWRLKEYMEFLLALFFWLFVIMAAILGGMFLGFATLLAGAAAFIAAVIMTQAEYNGYLVPFLCLYVVYATSACLQTKSDIRNWLESDTKFSTEYWRRRREYEGTQGGNNQNPAPPAPKQNPVQPAIKPQVASAKPQEAQAPVRKLSAKPSFGFSDIAGYEGTKASMQFIVSCIKDRKKLEKAGAVLPKGVLLYGPPGTGKTLLARAIAGEAGVAFFSANASSFVNTFVGTGAAEVRSLYEKARASAPSLVFIDELDALGARGGSLNTEYQNTINALLSELDGFDKESGVFTIAATNNLDMIDEALIRTGRFDRKVFIPLPNFEDRCKIATLHAKNKSLNGVTIESIAKKTAGFSGSDIKTLLNEAAIHSVRRGKTSIGKEDIEKAFFEMITRGEEAGALTGEEANIYSFHEAGHVLAAKILLGMAIPRVTINKATTGALGSTLFSVDNPNAGREYLKNRVIFFYAGRAAEELYLGDGNATDGCAQDIKTATALIKEYIVKYGDGSSQLIDMTEFGERKVVDASSAAALASNIYNETKKFILSNERLLRVLATELSEKKSLGDEEIDEILRAAC